jgi:Raf kinase inhibitor-like YbhB/YbcL family protein
MRPGFQTSQYRASALPNSIVKQSGDTQMFRKLPLYFVLSSASFVMAQAMPAGQPAAAPRTLFWVSSTAWPDGGVIPLKNAGRGENKFPAFEFHWNLGTDPGTAPATLHSYAVILHDVQNSTRRGTTDTLHWSAYNIPGTAKGLPEGLGPGTLADGTQNGPGIASMRGNQPAYFGPGAQPGPFHHYVFEFYALDTKLSFPATPSREDLLNAMEGHVIGKAAWFGRFPEPGA